MLNHSGATWNGTPILHERREVTLMTRTGPPSSEASPVTPSLTPAITELPPTSSAKMTISLRPDQLGGSAEGNVPPDQAHHLITTFGLLGIGVSGIAGANITLYIS